MKARSIAALLPLAAIALAVQAFQPEAPEPMASGDGYVMGQDFTTLLSNPNVALKVDQVGDTVNFAWTSPSSARLEETRQMGEYMRSIKRELELRSGPMGLDERSRTAGAGQ